MKKAIGTHKTTISYYPNHTCIKYWDTKIVKFNLDKISLDNGGFYTSTTKRRMNQVSNYYNLGFHVYQKNYNWYVETKDLKNNTLIIPFRNNKVELYNYAYSSWKANI